MGPVTLGTVAALPRSPPPAACGSAEPRTDLALYEPTGDCRSQRCDTHVLHVAGQ
ncbi:MAG: hypothetical protein JWR66_1086 [Modestobacter sp.]|nr:hypothetical protein [Modestobacter sp.]